MTTKKDTKSNSVIIPRYLSKCPVCGEWRNRARHVLCLCDGLVCGACGKSRRHRPISNYYDETTGVIVHVPHFGAMIPCHVCGKRAWVRSEPAWTHLRDLATTTAAALWTMPELRWRLTENVAPRRSSRVAGGSFGDLRAHKPRLAALV